MGIGMIIITSPDISFILKKAASSIGENIYEIGKIVRGNGKVIIKKS